MTRGRRGWLVVAAGLVVAVLTALWATGARQERTGRLDPDNPGPGGAQAVARVLDDEGVDVEVVRDAAALDRATLDGATVVVTSPWDLGRSTASRLLERARGLDVLVVEPTGEVARLLGSTADPAEGRPSGPVDAACDDPRLSGLRLDVDVAEVYPDASEGCFGLEDGSAYAPQGGGVAFLGAGDALSNGQVTRGDNAAVALRLLGGGSRLVWYVPDLADLRAGDQVGLGALLPRWLVPALWLTGLVVLATMLWRGRRLGALVTEPLPVTVRAVETTLSRGRLYRRSGDRAHAAATLRSAARSRAAKRLRLPRRTPEAALVPEVARAVGRPDDEVSALLLDHGPIPRTDAELTALARALAELDLALTPAAPSPSPAARPAPPQRSSP